MTREETLRARLLALVESAIQHDDLETLAQAADAIDRLHAGTYGLCASCGERLDEDRLLDNPLIRFCDNCTNDEQWRPFSPH